MSGVLEIVYDDVPPNSNSKTGLGSTRAHWRTTTKTKKEWTRIFGEVLQASGLPRGLTHVRVQATLYFTTPNTRRDGDNFYFPISKPLGDALAGPGLWLPDDTPEFYAFERVVISREKLDHPNPLVKGRMVLLVSYEP